MLNGEINSNNNGRGFISYNHFKLKLSARLIRECPVHYVLYTATPQHIDTNSGGMKFFAHQFYIRKHAICPGVEKELSKEIMY